MFLLYVHSYCAVAKQSGCFVQRSWLVSFQFVNPLWFNLHLTFNNVQLSRNSLQKSKFFVPGLKHIFLL